MNARLWRPTTTVDLVALERGLRWLVFDAVASQTMAALTGGAFLVTLALRLGASNTTIGMIAAIGPLASVLQLPAVALVERWRRRKKLVIVAALIGRLFWLATAALPFLPETWPRLPLLFACLLAYYGFYAVSGCAFSSWMRDLLPERSLGTFNARRASTSIALGSLAGVGAGFGVDQWKAAGQNVDVALAALFITGGLVGLVGIACLARVPEPKMAPSHTPLLALLRAPFRDQRFRQLLKFLGVWNFAVNLAAPFVTVYLLVEIKLSLTNILLLTIFSQALHVGFLGAWGRVADKYGNRPVLTVAGPLYMVSLLLWPLTTAPEAYALTIPLVVLIHALAGLSTAGVRLSTNGIALKLAPKNAATAYLSVNAVVSGLAQAASPIIAGVAADYFTDRELALLFEWHAPEHFVAFPALSISGFDFLFLGAAVVGLYAIHRILTVTEEGEGDEEEVRSEMMAEVRRAVRSVSTLSGAIDFALFPFARLLDLVSTPETPPDGEAPATKSPPTEPQAPDK